MSIYMIPKKAFVLLSGGLDSSLVAAVAASFVAQSICCLTFQAVSRLTCHQEAMVAQELPQTARREPPEAQQAA